MAGYLVVYHPPPTQGVEVGWMQHLDTEREGGWGEKREREEGKRDGEKRKKERILLVFLFFRQPRKEGKGINIRQWRLQKQLCQPRVEDGEKDQSTQRVDL
jgi:hypothetical protein